MGRIGVEPDIEVVGIMVVCMELLVGPLYCKSYKALALRLPNPVVGTLGNNMVYCNIFDKTAVGNMSFSSVADRVLVAVACMSSFVVCILAVVQVVYTPDNWVAGTQAVYTPGNWVVGKQVVCIPDN